MRVTNFATFSAVGMGVGLYAGRLIREYIRYMHENTVLHWHMTEALFDNAIAMGSYPVAVLYYRFMYKLQNGVILSFF